MGRTGPLRSIREYGGVAAAFLVALTLIGVALAPDPPRNDRVTIRTPRPTPASTPVPVTITPRQQDWHQVARFASDRSGNTERFIVGTKWRLLWDARDDAFDLLVYNDVGGTIDPGAISGSVLHRPGAHYLAITSSQPYEIIVEDWR